MLKALRWLQQVHCAGSRPTYGVVEANINLMSQALKSGTKARF